MSDSAAHETTIRDQFTWQAREFARSPNLHAEALLALMVEAAGPQAEDEVLDVACGPGSVVLAFAPHVRCAMGLDATPAMLDQARALAQSRGLRNVEWHCGDVYALPFADERFGIVTCRFAFHHLQDPARAFAEMLRVCRRGGRIVLCDGIASDDPEKAAAFNGMERLRDPSTVQFLTLSELCALFADANLPAPDLRRFRVEAERDALVDRSFPAGGDREALRRLIDASVDNDVLGMQAYRDAGTVRLSYPSVVLSASNTSPR
jgi:ubiquinone/menaquinone biosynthesis C-methylase UbiE